MKKAEVEKALKKAEGKKIGVALIAEKWNRSIYGDAIFVGGTRIRHAAIASITPVAKKGKK